MSLFSAEIATLVSAAAKITGGDVYSVPWYLVLGEPRTGKSTVIRSMNLTWQGDGKVPMPATAICSYFVAKEAVFIEAGDRICGPNKNVDFLRALCEELKKVRAREPLDALILNISSSDVAELTEQTLEPHAQTLRNYLVEVCKTLGADVPVYTIVNRYDTLWGFAEVFQWNADRAKEEAWGFVLPPETPSQSALPKIQEGIAGLAARIEAFCLARLSSEDGIEQRMRAFQHLSESKQFLEKLLEVMKIISFANRYERAPWVRALIVGAAVPGVGDRIRASIARFNNMGIIQNPYDQARATRPGGLPVFSFMRTTVLPEKELVPLRVRWRDDKLTVILFILGLLILIAAPVLAFAVWR
ncbi:MAG: type VI secretion system protein [Polyangiaceae bacterium]